MSNTNITVIMINAGFDCNYRCFITPGSKVEIHTVNETGGIIGVNIFNIGDFAEYSSFHLTYIGPIKQITNKGVTIHKGSQEDRCKRLKWDSFCWRNWDFDFEKVRNANAEIMLYI